VGWLRQEFHSEQHPTRPQGRVTYRLNPTLNFLGTRPSLELRKFIQVVFRDFVFDSLDVFGSIQRHDEYVLSLAPLVVRTFKYGDIGSAPF
jgi:hypothetical protein